MVPDLRHFINVKLITQTFYYTQLVLVKLWFLFFFRRLGQNIQKQKYIWMVAPFSSSSGALTTRQSV